MSTSEPLLCKIYSLFYSFLSLKNKNASTLKTKNSIRTTTKQCNFIEAHFCTPRNVQLMTMIKVIKGDNYREKSKKYDMNGTRNINRKQRNPPEKDGKKSIPVSLFELLT